MTSTLKGRKTIPKSFNSNKQEKKKKSLHTCQILWKLKATNTLGSLRSKKSSCLLRTGISHLIPKQHLQQPPMMLQPGVQQRGGAVVVVTSWQQPEHQALVISPAFCTKQQNTTGHILFLCEHTRKLAQICWSYQIWIDSGECSEQKRVPCLLLYLQRSSSDSC